MSSDHQARVSVDTSLCVGSGTCTMLDPEHFDVVDGKARVVQSPTTVTEELEDAILDCPVQAISRAPVGQDPEAADHP